MCSFSPSIIERKWSQIKLAYACVPSFGVFEYLVGMKLEGIIVEVIIDLFSMTAFGIAATTPEFSEWTDALDHLLGTLAAKRGLI